MRKSREYTAYSVTKRRRDLRNMSISAPVGFIKLCRPNYGELFLAVKITARRERGVRPVRNGGGKLADALAAAVPGNENAPDGRFAGLRYGGVALRRERQERGEALKLRLLPTETKRQSTPSSVSSPVAVFFSRSARREPSSVRNPAISIGVRTVTFFRAKRRACFSASPRKASRRWMRYTVRQISERSSASCSALSPPPTTAVTPFL